MFDNLIHGLRDGDVMPRDFLVDTELWNDSITIAMRERVVGVGVKFAKPLEFEERKNGEFVEPFVRLRNCEAQQLMDELWRCGIRPTDGRGSAGSLDATKQHLADMQKIAFAALHKAGNE